ncbi:MAG: zinc dependent phospholipase C family protein [Olsenella sp.]|nr:zinc dependent phospholipase C family protein [Olsenella sp.]
MPALITHHLFGEEAVTLLPEGIVNNQEELLAFLLGNQGPDPFYLRSFTNPETADRCHQLARAMHAKKVTEAFLALREGVSHLPEQDKTIGRAFALGLLAHYMLDSRTHAFIFGQQEAIVSAGNLQDAAHEVHGIIESDLDTWTLWSMRHLTILDVPAQDYLARTERIDHVAGALFSATARQVFGLTIPAGEFAGAVRNYELLYRAIDPLESRRVRILGAVERIVRDHSMSQAMAHTAHPTEDCPSANLARHDWVNPYTRAVSNASFPDLFFDTLAEWEHVAETYIKGEYEELGSYIGKVDYNGRPLDA